jgi:hypothetical protein
LNAELEALLPAAELERRVGDLENRHAELGSLAVAIDAVRGAEAALRRQSEFTHRHGLLAASLDRLTVPPALAPTQPLEERRAGLIAAAARCVKVRAVQQPLATLAVPPALVDIKPLRVLVDKIVDEEQAVERRRQERAALAGLQETPLLRETGPLTHLLKDLAAVGSACATAKGRCAELSRLAAPPELAEAAGLASVLASVRSAARLVARWQSAGAALRAVTPPVSPADTADLHKLLVQLDKAAGMRGEAEKLAVQADNDLAEARADLHALAEQNAVCPTCGAELDSERLIAHAAAHGGAGHG